MVGEIVPPAVGVNVTAKVADAPGRIGLAGVIPLTVNFTLLLTILLTVKFEVPVFCKANVRTMVFPTRQLPKSVESLTAGVISPSTIETPLP